MDYLDVKEQLELQKMNVLKKLDNPELTKEEHENLKNLINNYDYMIELTEMNHFERGIIH
ncbi:DUF3896 family protein [Neobacillus sp. SM06]|uniref:DUF3896 family protein n=1 Tax=Neobacillus sp. SM06 TaxID=3422492 RepID=UPI003D27DAAC